MKLVIKTMVFVLSLLATAVALGQPNSNTLYSVIVEDAPIFDISLLLHSRSENGATTEDLRLFIDHQASGRILGTGFLAHASSLYSFSADGPLSGRFRGRRYGFGFKSPLRGEDAAGQPLTGHVWFRAAITQEVQMETNFIGDFINQTCVTGFECTSNIYPFSSQASGRNWRLSFALETEGRRFHGTGEVMLISFRSGPTNFVGRVFRYAARGRFNPRTGNSIIRLSGLEEYIGSSFFVRADDAFAIQMIRGRLLGQRVRVKDP